MVSIGDGVASCLEIKEEEHTKRKIKTVRDSTRLYGLIYSDVKPRKCGGAIKAHDC